jgi:hypothetical protein
VPGTDYRSPAPFHAAVSQRRFLQGDLHPHGQRLRRRHPDRNGGATGSANVTWPVDSNGYYDVIITANTSDGFTRRYAGRIA